MHVFVLSSFHMDHRAYYMYYCSMFPYSCYMIVLCYWYGYSRYWTWELLICDMWNPTSIVPVILFPLYCSRFPLYCSMLSTELMSCYHVTRIMYCNCSCYLVYLTHKDLLGMGETWRLIRSYRVDVWIHCSSHCRGRGNAGYHLLLMLHVTALAGWPWSQQPGIW